MHQLVMASKDTVQAKCGEVFTLDKGVYLCDLPVTGWQSKVACDECQTAETVPPDPAKEAKRRGIKTTRAQAREAEKAARAKERAEALERQAQQAREDAGRAADGDASAADDIGPGDDDSALAVLTEEESAAGDDAAPDGDAPDPGGARPQDRDSGVGSVEGDSGGVRSESASVRPDGTPWDPDDRCEDGGVAPCPEPIDGRPHWGPDGWDSPDRWGWWWAEDPSHPERVAGEHRLAHWWAGRADREGPPEGAAVPVDEDPPDAAPSADVEPAAMDVEAGSAAPDAVGPAPDDDGMAGDEPARVHGPDETEPDHAGAAPDGPDEAEADPGFTAVRPRREHELTEPIVFPHVPVVISASGTVLVLEHQDDIPGVFAFDSDQWCVDATIEIRPNRRK